MDLLTGLFVTSLFQAVEKIWEKVFDAAWDPLDVELKDRFTRQAGKGAESERRKAFTRASNKAKRATISQAEDSQQTETILKVLNRDANPKTAHILAEEAAKVLLFSEQPDVERMIDISEKQLKWEGFLENKTAPNSGAIALTLQKYLDNLRLGLLDESSYHDLIQHEMLRALQKNLQTSADNIRYDGEAEYISQLIKRFQYLDFVGIPELKDRQSLRIEDLFVHLQAKIE